MASDGVAGVVAAMLGSSRPDVLWGACCRLAAALWQGQHPRAWAEALLLLGDSS
jgi:hypothetical protein